MSNETSEDIELQQALKAVAASKQRLADANAARLQAVRASIAKREVDELAERNRQLEAYNAKIKILEDCKAAKKAEHAAEQRRKDAEQQEMQAQAERLEEAQRVQQKRDAVLARLADEAAATERESARIEADLLREATPIVEPLPPTLATTPLSFLFGGDRVAPAEPAKPLSVAEPLAPAHQDPVQPPTLRPDDPMEIRALASAFLQYGVRLSALAGQNLLRRFTPAQIDQAILSVAQMPPITVENVERYLWTSMSLNGTISCGQ